ncbi:MAG: PAS domain-containing protein [Betaproteobacteria bacterium]|nr:PAS domain-containing protein [Betaproteobacteria bacterium]
MLADLTTQAPSTAETAPTLLAMIDLKGQFTYVNRALAALSGCAPRDMVGKPLRLLLHPDMAPEAMADLWQTIESGRNWMGMVKYRHVEKHYCWFQCTITPQMENGAVSAYLLAGVKPSVLDIAVAEQTHGRFRKGLARDWRFAQGSLVQNSQSDGLLTKHSLSTGQHIGIAVAAYTLAIGGVSALLVDTHWAWVMGTSLILGGALATYLNRQVALPLKLTKQFLQQMQSGDFCADIKRQDEIGDIQRALIQQYLNNFVMMADLQERCTQPEARASNNGAACADPRPAYFTTDSPMAQDMTPPSFIVSVEGDLPSQQLSDIVRAISAAMQQQTYGQPEKPWMESLPMSTPSANPELDPNSDQLMMNEAMALFKLRGEGSQISSLARARQAKLSAVEALTKAAGSYPIKAVPHTPKTLPPPQLRKWRNGKWDFF